MRRRRQRVERALGRLKDGAAFVSTEALAFWLGFGWGFSNARKWAHTFNCSICEWALLGLGKEHRDQAAKVVYYQDEVALEQLEKLRNALEMSEPPRSLCNSCQQADERTCPVAHEVAVDDCAQYEQRPDWQTKLREVLAAGVMCTAPGRTLN